MLVFGARSGGGLRAKRAPPLYYTPQAKKEGLRGALRSSQGYFCCERSEQTYPQVIHRLYILSDALKRSLSPQGSTLILQPEGKKRGAQTASEELLGVFTRLSKMRFKGFFSPSYYSPHKIKECLREALRSSQICLNRFFKNGVSQKLTKFFQLFLEFLKITRIHEIKRRT